MTDGAVAIAVTPGELAKIGPLSPSSRPLVMVGGLLLIGQLLGGTTAYAVPESATFPASIVESWTNNGAINLAVRASEVAAREIQTSRSLQDSLLLLRDLSGLTWDQIARLFGVSRRAMHLWASGGRMNSYHAEELSSILTAVSAVPADTAAQRREMILAPGADGRTLYEALLERHTKRLGVNAPALPPEQLTDALHDRSDA